MAGHPARPVGLGRTGYAAHVRDTMSEVPSTPGRSRYGRARPGLPGSQSPRKDSMNSRLRVVLILVVVAIVLYFVIAQPDQAAATVRTILSAIGDAINQIIRFFKGLTA
jgi:hypothetical protein